MPLTQTYKGLRLNQGIAIGISHHATLINGGMCAQRIFNFNRRYPNATDLQHIVEAPGVMIETLVIDVELVAGTHPLTTEILLSFVILVQVKQAEGFSFNH